jgi:hypothetical protein
MNDIPLQIAEIMSISNDGKHWFLLSYELMNGVRREDVLYKVVDNVQMESWDYRSQEYYHPDDDDDTDYGDGVRKSLVSRDESCPIIDVSGFYFRRDGPITDDAHAKLGSFHTFCCRGGDWVQILNYKPYGNIDLFPMVTTDVCTHILLPMVREVTWATNDMNYLWYQASNAENDRMIVIYHPIYKDFTGRYYKFDDAEEVVLESPARCIQCRKLAISPFLIKLYREDVLVATFDDDTYTSLEIFYH